VPETTVGSAVTLRSGITANDAVKVDALVSRVLGDMGSIYRRAYNAEGGLPKELMELRRWLREVQDAVRDQVPEAFYK
jgi:hypothetical protein